eukprot:TRINITY_DN13061_c0_g1_i11.p2 TRINITY_DN13061_c0_g1~~TRINITY_DN13061_c0_g1_i11.p2  ORF type:complete len:370 (-),score=41.47 TRINITY_DN13061_c0_g1_i11:770-1879(-)
MLGIYQWQQGYEVIDWYLVGPVRILTITKLVLSLKNLSKAMQNYLRSVLLILGLICCVNGSEVAIVRSASKEVQGDSICIELCEYEELMDNVTSYLPASQTIKAPPGWTLVWNDEFDGTVLDRNKWGYEVDGWGGGNSELQYYTERLKNVKVENGDLVITARRERFCGGPFGCKDFTSARIRTIYRGDWLYARVEVRAKLPKGKGIWPAIWMLPTDFEYGMWAASGEIDIVEMRGQLPNTILGTLHFGGEWPGQQGTYQEKWAPSFGNQEYVWEDGDFSEDFHEYALEWDPGEIRWYIDGRHFLTHNNWISIGDLSNPLAPFDKRFHLIMNIAVGGQFVGTPDLATEFPQEMRVDYVRVFQRPGLMKLG